MNLNHRIKKFENKFRPGNGVTVIELEKGETNEQATQRYCAENDITPEELNIQSELTGFLRTHFKDLK